MRHRTATQKAGTQKAATQKAAMVLGATIGVLGALTAYAQDEFPIATSPTRAPIVNTADPAIPGAEERIVDVPSALYWSRFQRGYVDGWEYSVFPDGSAKILRAPQPSAPSTEGTVAARGENPERTADFTMTCVAATACDILRPDGTSFRIPAINAPRPALPTAAGDALDGETVARYLAQWVLAGSGTAPTLEGLPVLDPYRQPPQPPVPQSQAVSAAASDATNARAAQLLDDSNPEVTSDQITADLPETETPPQDDIPEQESEVALCSEPDPVIPGACAQPTEPSVPISAEQETQAAETEGPSEDTLTPVGDIGETDIAARGSPARTQPTARTATTTRTPQKAAPKTYWERMNLRCSITATTSLGYASGGSGKSIGKPRASLGCSANLTEKLSLRASLQGYADASEQSADDPDFTYAFSYRFSEKINLSYSNYAARFDGGFSGFINSLLSGSLRGSYALPTITLPNDKSAACSASLGLPRVLAESLNLSCGYAVTDKFRIGGTARLYAPGKQGDYDPDYSYTASYRPSEDWLISYSNYANNRFPWNRNGNESDGLLDGSLSVTYALKF
ncbi:hypothetical protein [Albirhodobacter sp. R86504]|uniref:hypothetical protein n=1 Tax=Albirhodobacter sp. R86504 TaxID=3093848 RepID=UPI00366BB21D